MLQRGRINGLADSARVTRQLLYDTTGLTLYWYLAGYTPQDDVRRPFTKGVVAVAVCPAGRYLSSSVPVAGVCHLRHGADRVGPPDAGAGGRDGRVTLVSPETPTSEIQTCETAAAGIRDLLRYQSRIEGC